MEKEEGVDWFPVVLLTIVICLLAGMISLLPKDVVPCNQGLCPIQKDVSGEDDATHS